MFEADIFSLICKSLVLALYGGIFAISVLFTFYEKRYDRFSDLLNVEFLSYRVLIPIEQNIYVLDSWLTKHKKIIGPILIFTSLYELILLFNIVGVAFK